MKNLKNFYNKLIFGDFFYFCFILQFLIISLPGYSYADNLEKSNEIVYQMMSKAKKHAIDYAATDPIEKSLKIKLLIKQYINLNFMAKATTGSFWKMGTDIQKEKYKTALLDQIVDTVEDHLNTLSSLNYRTVDSEKRGKKLVYLRGKIEDPKNIKPPVNLLWKLGKTNEGLFLILDLEIEGISLVSSHKAETMSILRKNKGNFEILLKKHNKIK
ncbi:ABC transporter substrate-binding protein [Alphaproteobacteria bacterium]|nr:ABC transporter substrate-binding protein [Alphaproteobacteria bacterium]